MWISLLHHVKNEHVWILGKCGHINADGEDCSTGPPTDKDGRVPAFPPASKIQGAAPCLNFAVLLIKSVGGGVV